MLWLIGSSIAFGLAGLLIYIYYMRKGQFECIGNSTHMAGFSPGKNLPYGLNNRILSGYHGMQGC